jgi:hypothetical protein
MWAVGLLFAGERLARCERETIGMRRKAGFNASQVSQQVDVAKAIF